MLSKITCTSESVFKGALTRGAKYTLLAADKPKRQVQIKGDNGRTRWFPLYCFDLLGREAPTMVAFEIDDSLEQVNIMPLEVTVTLSNGQRRWCVFATPAALVNTGDWISGTQVRFHYSNRHLIVAGELNPKLIEQILHEVDSQGELVSCTLPLEHETDACEDIES